MHGRCDSAIHVGISGTPSLELSLAPTCLHGALTEMGPLGLGNLRQGVARTVSLYAVATRLRHRKSSYSAGNASYLRRELRLNRYGLYGRGYDRRGWWQRHVSALLALELTNPALRSDILWMLSRKRCDRRTRAVAQQAECFRPLTARQRESGGVEQTLVAPAFLRKDERSAKRQATRL